ncbi:hypothetical protein M3Y96_00422700 [Aphelenchoides besseyi]|nr:hypothetical protein M3Y96_00422700 [Aphelenchoides besseyi]
MSNFVFLLLLSSALLISSVPAKQTKSVLKGDCPNLGRIISNSTEAKIQVFANVTKEQKMSIEIKGCKFALIATPEGFKDVEFGAVYDSPLTFISANDSVEMADANASDSCPAAKEEPVVVDIKFLDYDAGIEVKFDPTVIWFYEEMTLMDNADPKKKKGPKPWVFVVIVIFVIFCLIPSIVLSCISSFCRAILPCC